MAGETNGADHRCIWCPTDVRNLYAVAHNAHGAVDRALTGSGSWERARHKLGELGSTLRDVRPALDAHFDGCAPTTGITQSPLHRKALDFIGPACKAERLRIVEWLHGDEAEAIRAKAIAEDFPPEDALADAIEAWTA